jgi:hypothetical protein
LELVSGLQIVISGEDLIDYFILFFRRFTKRL